jgi:hypothetical protein
MYSAKQKTNFFFSKTSEDETHHVYTCQCGVTRKVKKTSNGYSNFVNHIELKHPEYSEIMKMSEKKKGLDKFFLIDPKVKNLYSWLEWVVMEGRELEFVNKELVRLLLKLRQADSDKCTGSKKLKVGIYFCPNFQEVHGQSLRRC